MTTRSAIFTLAIAPVLLSADKLVTLETATPIEICPSCTNVHVLVIPDGKSKIKLDESPKVAAAYFSGAAPLDAKKFPARWEGVKFPQEVTIDLDPNQTTWAGTYDFYLDLQPTSDPGASRLKIQVTRPAATVESIPKLIIDRTYWFIGMSSDTHPNVLVTETSKKAIITISGIRHVSNSSIGTEPIGGTLKFPEKQPGAAPGHQVTLDYSLDGEFPLGTATGTMKIDAPQLASPVSFDFEVRSRVHWIYIGITIAVGLVISYLLKVRLQNTIEFDQAHLDAQKLVDRVQQEEARRADPSFAAAYKSEFDALTTAMSGNSAADINTTKLALDTAWHTALQALAKKHQEQLDALDKLRDITNYDWLVPPLVSKAVEDARTALAEVAQLIERDDLTRAGTRRKQIILDLGNTVAAAAIEWQTGQEQILTALHAGPAGISAAISSALAKPSMDLLASLHKIDATTQTATPEQIQQALSDIKFERTSVRQFVEWLSTAIQMECSTAEVQIPQPPPAAWDAAIFAVAPAAVTAFTNFLKTLVDRPDFAGLPVQLAKVHQAWTSGLQKQFPAPDQLVRAQLDARDYIGATKVAFQQKTRGLPAGVVPGVESARQGFIAPEFHRDSSGASAPPMYSIRTRFQTIATPTPAVRTSVTDETKLRRDKMTQSFVIGLVLIVAGYGLQLNTFVGTFTDFSTLFFWAFGLDLAVDQIGKVTKKA